MYYLIHMLIQLDVCEVQLAHGIGQAHQHLQLHHHEVLGRPEVLILIHIRCHYLGAVTVFDS